MPTTQVGVFSVEGTTEQISWIADAEARCTYPLDRMLPRMSTSPNGPWTSVRVVFRPGSDPIFQGQYWAFAQTTTKCTITVRSDLPASSPIRATKVIFIHEVGHFVDAFVFTDARRLKIHRYYHGMDPFGTVSPNHGWWAADPAAVASGFSSYHSEQQEGFASDFIPLFSDIDRSGYQTTYSHRLLTSRYPDARKLILTGNIGTAGTEPEPPPPPPGGGGGGGGDGGQPGPVTPPVSSVDLSPYDPCSEA